MLLSVIIAFAVFTPAFTVFCYRLGLRDNGERNKKKGQTDASRYRELLLSIDRYNGTGRNQKK